MNSTANNNHWLRLELTGVESNRDAYGSHIRVVSNGASWIQEINGGSSHASQNSSIVHIGLGSDNVVDSIIVIFPSGIEQILTDVTADQTISIVEDIPTSVISTDNRHSIQLSYTTGGCLLSIKLASDAEFEIIVHDASGRMVHQIIQKGKRGLNSCFIENPLSQGLYTVQVKNPSINWSQKLVVIH